MNTFGPHLKLWTSSDSEWVVSVLFGQTEKAAPSVSYKLPGSFEKHQETMEWLEKRGTLNYFRIRIAVPLHGSSNRITYSISASAKRHSFCVPKIGELPRICYGSCNGFYSQKILNEFLESGSSSHLKATAMWRSLLVQHKRSKYSVMILGGDQVYSDIALERFESEVLKWSWNVFKKERAKRKLSDNEQAQLRDIYTEMYLNSWGNNPEMKEMLATCPALMMWDDHDIMDGWGSYQDKREEWPVFEEGVFPEARRAFLLYQHHCKPTEKPGGTFMSRGNFSTAHVSNGLGIVHIVTRSDRTQQRILIDDDWQKFGEWRAEQTELKHLFLCVSVPMIYADFKIIESIARTMPFNQGIEDDLQDHWRSVPHQICRARLLKDLFAFSKQTKCRVTIVSGDVHVAAHGVAELKDGQGDHTRTNRIHQLVSSPIMNKAGNPFVEKLVEWQGDAKEVITPTMTARMLPLQIAEGASSKTQRYIWERNWLSLLPQSDGAYRAEWHFEGADYPCRETINSI